MNSIKYHILSAFIFLCSFQASTYDGGGYLNDYIATMLDMNARNAEISITGTCISACITYLNARNLKLSPLQELGYIR